MADGKGCKCAAYSEAECGCDADWTPQEVYDLRAEMERLVAEVTVAWVRSGAQPPSPGGSPAKSIARMANAMSAECIRLRGSQVPLDGK
jgi:hypothetical protein